MNLTERVADYVRSNRLFEPHETVLVAVSGGPDSLCLLYLLADLHSRLAVAHFDHGLRPGGDQEAAFVETHAGKLRLPFHSGSADVRAAAKAAGESIEAAGRRLRYQYLVEAARRAGASAIATGHTRTDQAETVLLHLLRGAGPDGLAGMAPAQALGTWPELDSASGLRLIRPLLSLSRSETIGWCGRRGLQPLRDPSNQDPQFERNRLRQALMPQLERFNPEVEAALARTAAIMRAQADHMRQHSHQILERTTEARTAGELALDRMTFLQLHAAEQRSLLRALATSLSAGLCQLTFERVEAAREFVELAGHGQLQLGCGLALTLAGGQVVVGSQGAVAGRSMPQLQRAVELPLETSVSLGAGWQLRLTTAARPPSGGWDKQAQQDQDEYRRREWFDADALDRRLRLRRPHAGDRLRPFGMKGTVKVGDLFTNEQIDKKFRAGWPLLFSGSELLWVVGLRRGAAAPLSPSTKAVLEARLVGPN